MVTHMETTYAPAAAHLATVPTVAILATLVELDATETLTREETVAIHWMLQTIEERYNVAEAMDAWAMDLATELTYVETLIQALPAEAFR